MRHFLSTLVISSLFVTSFSAFAVEKKSLSQIITENMESKLSGEELAKKTTFDMQANGISTEEVNEYLKSELSPINYKKVKLAQAQGINPASVQNLMENLGKGAQFAADDLLCLNGGRGLLLIGAAVVALASYYSASCDLRPSSCPIKRYDDPSAGRAWEQSGGQYVDYNGYTHYYSEPSYSYSYGSYDPESAKTNQTIGAIALGVAAVTSLSCAIHP